MSVRRRQNFLGQQRVDAPHLKSIESAVSNDFDELIKGLIIGENKSYVVRGLQINMPGSIGASASGLQLLVENSAILHGASNESGTFYVIPAGTPSEVLSSTTNERVEGAFTPNTDNYVGLEFVRAVDDTTTDQVNFWNPTSNVEFSKTVPLAITLDYKIVISTSSFASNVMPIAVILTDGSNNVISITDRRPLLYRLGTAGDQTPSPFYQYPWTDGRTENFYTSTSSTSNPFFGGDKQITTMKDFFDALMTEFKLLKGTPFWYSESAGSISRLRQDIANTAFTGKGSIIHGTFDFQGIVTGMTTSVIIKTVNISSAAPITLTANSFDSISTMIATYNAANPENQVYLYSGNGAQVPTVNITLTSKAGQLNWTDELYISFIGGRLRYAILANEATDDIVLTNNQVAYLELVRGVNIIPNLVFTQGGTVVTSVGSVNWTSDLQAGDFIKDASRGDEFYYEITSIDSLSQVTLTTPFLEISSGAAGFDAQYAFGVYETNAAPSSSRHVQVADRGSVPFGEDYFWLFYRQDDTGGIAKVYARVLGGQELQQGEWQEVSDNTSEAILQYIGSPSESDIEPDYTNALGVARTNIHLNDGENLTRSLKRLEQRDDVVPRVRAIDLVSTSLPTGASVTIDSETLANGDYVFFINSPIEGLYEVSGVGTAVSFEKLHAFGGSQQPVDGDLIRVEAGTSYLRTVWKRASNHWKPMEVQDAAKEPTGFPNRTDSEISFDNLSRTLSISPKSPATHFDVFTKGRVFRFESAQQVTIPNNEGVYFFYFNTSGVLSYSTVFNLTLLTENIYVANIYWSVSQAQPVLFGDERHGITMDGATHEYLHTKNGAVVTSGGAINFVTSPTGNADADAEITLGNIVFRDEDIRMDITNSASPSNIFEQILDPIAEIPVLYRDGAAGDWKRDVATTFPVKQGSSRIQFNQYSLGAWSQVDAQEGYYVSMWIFATNNFSEPVIAILGQAEHATLSEAQAEDSYDSLNFGIMPAQEYKVLYRIIFQTSSAFTNTPKAAVFDVRDLRSSVDTQFAQVAPNDHGLLSGLADPDHAPTAVTTVGVTKDGGLSDSDIDLQQSLDTLNKLFGQLRLKEHPVDKKRVVVTGSDRILNNGQKLIQSLKNLVLSFEGAEIDFGTGNVYADDGVTILGVNFTPATIATSEYFNYSVTIIPSAVNLDNTITAQIIVLPADSSNLVKADAPRAVFAKGIQLGQVTVQENSGGIEDISQADISQLGTGGGAGGTGTGDANSFTENLKHRLTSSYYEYVTPVIFETDEENLTDSATASYSIVDGVYKFSAAGQNFVSVNMFDTDFLEEDHDSRQVELHAEWFSDATRDDNATYEVSLDGTNYETLTMVRQGYSQKFTGSKQLAIPSSVVIASQSSGSTSTELNGSTIQSFSAPITISSKSAVNSFTIEIDKLGSPVGSYTVSFCKDDSGVPGDIVYSRIFLNSTLSSGVNSLIIDDFRAVLVPGTYHIVVGTDATYKAGFSAGVNSISVVTTASGGNDLVFDGSAWSAGTVDLKYSLSGHAYDLRVRVTSSGSDKKLKAFGIFYDEQVEFLGETTKALQQFSFSGDLNTTSFSVTNFLPNSDLLKVYDVTTGQVYRSPAFSVLANNVTFPSGTFLAPGETVTLLFDQMESSGFGEVTFSGGAGGGGGVDNVDSLLVQNFDSSSLGDFTQTGLSLITVNPLNGSQCARLIHAASSTQSFKQTLAVDPKFRGVNMTASLTLRSSASEGNVTIAFRDEINAIDYPSQSLSLGSQQIASLTRTSGSPTVSGFTTSNINTLKAGMTVTGSGIPTGTTILSVNSSAFTITLSQSATSATTGSLSFSSLPKTVQLGFFIPENCSSYSYTISALPEASSPETYVDDIVLRNYWFGMSNQGQSIIEVPTIEQQSSFISQNASFTNATITGVLTSQTGSGIYSYNSVTGIYTVAQTGLFNLGFSLSPSTAASIGAGIVVNGSTVSYDVSVASANFPANSAWSGIIQTGGTFYFFNGSLNASNSQNISVSAQAVTTTPVTTTDLVPAKAVLGNTAIDIPNITAWQGYTPTFQGFGTPTNVEMEWRQVGENVEIRGRFDVGTLSGVEARVGLPAGLSSAGTSLIPSLTVAGDGATDYFSSLFYRVQVLMEPSVSYVTFSRQTSTSSTLTKINATELATATGQTISLKASIPCAGLSATQEVVVSGTQSALVEEGDSNFKGKGFVGQGTTNTGIVRLSSDISSLGDAITYSSSATLGDSWTVNKSGIYGVFGSVDTSNTTVGVQYFFTRNSSLLTVSASTSFSLENLIGSVGYTTPSADVAQFGGTTYLEAGDIIRLQCSVASSTSSNGGYDFITITHQGSLKVLNTNADQKITIPTSELRFEGASTKGSTATAIVKFDTLAKIRGDAFTVESDSVLGTRITMKKAGKLDVTTSLQPTNGSIRISINQAILTSLPTVSETLAGESNVAVVSSLSASRFVQVGDVIRVVSDGAVSSTTANTLSLLFQEQEIAVSVTNTLPQFSDSDSSVRVDTANGYGSTGTKIRRFSNVRDNIGTDIEYTDSAADGASFTAMSSGIYMISYSEQTTLNTTPRIGISKNASSLINNIDDISANERLAISSDEGGSSASKYMSVSWQGYLQSGDIIRPHSSGQTNTVPGGVTFTISKVGKPNVTGVDVTPFVNTNLQLASRYILKTFQSGSSWYEVYNDGWVRQGGRTGAIDASYLTSATLQITMADTSYSVLGIPPGVSADDFSWNINSISTTVVTFRNRANVGNMYYIVEGYGNVSAISALGVTLEDSSRYLLTPTDTFSTDTASLAYSSSYTLSTLEDAPVGTYITFTYAANTNTRTQTAIRPTQTDADMNANGILLYTRAYNAASTAAQPAAIAIQIGKGLKGRSVDVYKNASKEIAGSLEFNNNSSFAQQVGSVDGVIYDEKTGILTLDLGLAIASAITTSLIRFNDLTTQTSGYIVINASKSPALTGVPLIQPRIATITSEAASGTASPSVPTTYGAMTLNTLSDSTGIVTSLSSNQVVLQPGTYRMKVFSSAKQTTVAGNTYKTKIRNITASSDALIGQAVGVSTENVGRPYSATSIIDGEVVINTASTFEVQHRAFNTGLTQGLTAAFGDNEVFATVTIQKVK
jgi:hypothetical protein